MRTSFKLAALAALLLAAAASNTKAQSTNVDLVLNIELNAISQGSTYSNNSATGVNVNRSLITSRTIVEALGTATSNSFSRSAQLVIVAPTNELENWHVQVRNGTNAVDVSGFFTHTPGQTSLGAAWMANRSDSAGGTDFSLDTFSLQNQAGYPALPFTFTVMGVTVTSMEALVSRNGNFTALIDSISANVSGDGDSGGNFALFEGSVNASYFNAESTAPSPSTDEFGF